MENYVNYHKHTHYSNIITPDSAVTPSDYAKRVVELGQTVLSGLEHGYQGNYIETYELAKENGLKFLFGTEAYIVKDRTMVVDDKKDATNSHIVLLAKNELGRKGINRILSQANIDGFYYKPRIDLELLFTLDKNSVWVTSACIAGLWKYDDYERIFLDIYSHFGNNFFLEVQNHDIKRQAELNKRIINLSNRHGINIIAGMDSHYIYPQQSKERDDFLASRNIEYEDEVGWNMDFPSYEEAFIRFQKQGALTDAQIKEALNNTLVFEQVEEYQSRIFNKDIKLPTLYPEKQQDEKNQIFINLVNEKWQIEKENVPRTKWNKYEKEIKTEVDTVVETGMADYFLLDYEIIKKGIADGGHITLTSRGSAPSYYISKLLGFTTIDRISAEVKLFPERFITKERILEAGTLPDIDFNLGNPEIFAQAQKDILGDDNSYPMIAYGTARPKASWKIYARAKGIDFDRANDISKDIDRYEMALKHAETEDEREEIDVLDYINPKFIELYKESQIYKGIISDAKIAPCGYLIYDEPISEEIGLIKLKENICTVMDGSWAEKYSFLKNDLLKVSVVELIYRIYKRIGIKPHSLPELIKLCNGNNKVWEVYKNGWTMGINQLEQDATRGRVAKYAPKNISELSAFIAAIRPGFKSYYSRFESREPFEYGIKTLDELIQTEQFPYSYMLYQENAMQVLAYSGIRISETYEIIKNIAKKRAEKVYKYKDRFIDGMKNRLMKKESLDEIASAKVAQNTWQVIEDSAHYSFNSCFAGDTIIQRAGMKKNIFSPTIEEMYLIMNNKEYAISTNHKDLYYKYQYSGYGNALSMFPDGRIRKNKIVDIRYQGNRQTYRITTESGAYAISTDNHKFPTPNGDKRLDELKIGDVLYTKGSYEKFPDIYRLTDGNFKPNFPKVGEQGFQEKEDGAFRILNDFIMNNKDNQLPCEICSKPYSSKGRFEAHHKDFDRLNKDICNLQWLCVSCHKKEHYNNGSRNRTYSKGIPTKLEKIVSIELDKTQNVYDIEMLDPAHNVITESGLIASNSHAYSVAGDSLYGAYLKSHYPLEFYETLLTICEEDGDKDRLAKAKEEAKHAYKISFPPYRFGQDNRNIVLDKDNWAITSSLKSIKSFGKKVGEDMYALSQLKFDSFFDLLIYAENNGILYSHFEKLIYIQYFDNFGGNKKLYKFYKEFTEGKNRYSSKHTDKTKEKRLVALKEYWDSLQDENFDLSVQLSLEDDILGNIQAQYNIPKDYLYVMAVDLQYAPRATVYCLANGKINSIKIRKKVFDENVFYGGEVIKLNLSKRSDGRLLYFIKEPRRKYVGDGKYEDDLEDFDWWAYKYDIISPDNFNEIVKGTKKK